MAARRARAVIVDPRNSSIPEITAIYAAYPPIGPVLPAIGYSSDRLLALKTAIAESQADILISASPFDIARVLQIEKPVLRARYDFAEIEDPKFSTIVEDFLEATDERDSGE